MPTQPATMEPTAKRDEDLEEALDQHPPVHAQDAADDDRSDVEIKEIGELGEVDDRLLNLRREELVVGERRRNEGREDRAGPDAAQDRQSLADLGAGEAAEDQHCDHGRRIGLDLADEVSTAISTMRMT